MLRAMSTDNDDYKQSPLLPDGYRKFGLCFWGGEWKQLIEIAVLITYSFNFEVGKYQEWLMINNQQHPCQK